MLTDEDIKCMVVYERMQYHFQTLKEQGIPISPQEQAYERVIETMSNEDRKIIEDFVDRYSEDLSERNEFYYRKGLEDGVKLDKLIQSWKEKQ